MWLRKLLFVQFITFFVNLNLVLCLMDHDVHLWGQGHRNLRIMGNVAAGKYTPVEEKDPEFWRALAKRELAARLSARPSYNKAKYIVFFLGDGMALTTVPAARIRKGQLKGKTGEEESLSFEKFPWVGLSKTYCSNSQVADSACTATAYLCGVKANIMTIGVSANVEYNNCTMDMDPKNHVSSLADWAQKASKSSGFITTSSLTHASPSGMYAHSASRFWECDADLLNAQQNPYSCMDMAQQLIKKLPGRNLDVMMGGGMGKFLPNTLYDAHGLKGERRDGQNLLLQWLEMLPKGAVVTDRSELLKLNIKNVDKIMGLFNSKLMDFHAHADKEKQPRLAEMTEVAITFLAQKNKKGFVIFIEGGLIDYGNHYNKPGLSIHETLEFEQAIERAYNLTNPKETLIVVISDHAHPLSISGYPGRGTPILGVNHHDVDRNGRRYATLNYAVGPQQYLDAEGKTLNLEGIIEDVDAIHPSQISRQIGVHAGDDVGIFATGPFSHLFAGVLQQNSIPH